MKDVHMTKSNSGSIKVPNIVTNYYDIILIMCKFIDFLRRKRKESTYLLVLYKHHNKAQLLYVVCRTNKNVKPLVYILSFEVCN
jgi:hypothetical protein